MGSNLRRTLQAHIPGYRDKYNVDKKDDAAANGDANGMIVVIVVAVLFFVLPFIVVVVRRYIFRYVLNTVTCASWQRTSTLTHLFLFEASKTSRKQTKK